MQRLIAVSTIFLSFVFLGSQANSLLAQNLSVKDFELRSISETAKTIQIVALQNDAADASINGSDTFVLNGDSTQITFQNGVASFDASALQGLIFVQNPDADLSFKLYHVNQESDSIRLQHIPLWLSILPPLLAIFLALVYKEVLISLFSGVWLGAFIVNGLNFKLLLMSLLNTIDKYALDALTESGHAAIVIFSLMIGGMVAVISRNGGMQGVVDRLSVFAKNKRRSQLVTWFLGIAIFFDDYANTLIVGNTMRPVTDRFKISREKLSYIVDATAAPVASIAFITTWIGAELDYIGSALHSVGVEESAYSMFLGSLEYAHYSIFTILFMFLLIWMQRDYGPMHAAEQQAENADVNTKSNDDPELKALEMKPGVKPQAINAILPILTVVITVMLGLLYTGATDIWNSSIPFGQKLSQTMGSVNALSATIGAADSYTALLWASLMGVGVSIAITLGRRLLTLQETMEVTIKGFKSLLIAMLILITAWSLGTITGELHTADFLTSLMVGNVSPHAIPLLTFLLAAGVSFSTGSSWSTMAILYPIMLPTTWLLCNSAGLDHATSIDIMYYSIAVIMGGSVFGDHCSPISDTTILSSLASSCDHIQHVRTQMPYALTVALVSLVIGGGLFFFSTPWYIIYPAGVLCMYGIIKVLGKTIKPARTGNQ